MKTSMTLTRQQLDKLERDAAKAMREGLGYGDAQPGDPHRSSRLLAAAVKAGISHRVLALRSGISGLVIARAIEDETAQNNALVVERHHAERYVAQVMEEIRGRALYLHLTVGRTKTQVCEALLISRPTLDAWLRQAVADEQVA